MLSPTALILHKAKHVGFSSAHPVSALSSLLWSPPVLPLLPQAWIAGLLGLRLAKYLQSIYYFLLMLRG